MIGSALVFKRSKINNREQADYSNRMLTNCLYSAKAIVPEINMAYSVHAIVKIVCDAEVEFPAPYTFSQL